MSRSGLRLDLQSTYIFFLSDSALNIYFEESDYSFPENVGGTIIVRKDSINVAPVTVSVSFLTYEEEELSQLPTSSCPDPAECKA